MTKRELIELIRKLTLDLDWKYEQLLKMEEKELWELYNLIKTP